jgi:hypothetical protein
MKKAIVTLTFFALISAAMAQAPATTAPATNAQTPATTTQPSQTVATTPAPAPNPNAPDFKFDQDQFDFGTIPQGTPVTHDFNFTNIGKEPLIISNAQASCGCTIPNWPKDPVLPGKTSKITVTYNAAHAGGFTKSITITSNAKTPMSVIYIKGTVQAKPVDQTTPNQPASVVSTPHN